MTSMDDMHRMMHGEQESHDEYMRRAMAARDEGNWEMGSMFEMMARDESQHMMNMGNMVERMGGEKAPLYPSMPTSLLGGAGMPTHIPGTGGKRQVPTTYGEWTELAEDIKDRYPLDSPERAEVNFQLGILLELEEGRPDDAKRWLVGKAGELGIQ